MLTCPSLGFLICALLLHWYASLVSSSAVHSRVLDCTLAHLVIGSLVGLHERLCRERPYQAVSFHQNAALKHQPVRKGHPWIRFCLNVGQQAHRHASVFT